MQRIATLLSKIQELSNKTNGSLIEIDLMMDYTKVLYADLLEWRNKVAFTEPLIIRTEPELKEMAAAMEENHSSIEKTPEIAAPAVELDTTSLNYESVKTEAAPSQVSFSRPQYIRSDIRELIGINDKYLYISELFGNNKEAYEEVINELNSFDTEEEAIGWLRNNVYREYNWNEDVEAVQYFFSLVGEFFAER
jgi:hypothetical protein